MKYADTRVLLEALKSRTRDLPLPPEDENFGELTLDELAKVYVEVKSLHAALDQIVKSWYHFKEYFNKRLLPEKLEDMGLDKASIPSIGYTVYPLHKYSASMKDRDAGMDWLRSHEGKDLIKETVNAQTLTSFLRSRMEDEGIDPPDDLFNFNSYTITGMTKYTPKEK